MEDRCDVHSSGCLNEVTNPDMVKNCSERSALEIARDCKYGEHSSERVFNILNQYLGMKTSMSVKGAAFAHCRPKATTSGQFIVVFGTV